ncbi:MAG: class I adenylate-forming enzyme family protein [Candidatus Hydrogenedentota bacterium]
MNAAVYEPPTRDEAIATMNADTSPFATHTENIGGVDFEVYTHAPGDMRDYFNFSNEHFADNEFLIYGDERITFGEVHRKSVALAYKLQEIGVKPGDRVGISMRNYPEYAYAVEATLAVGAVAVTLNSWWQEDELEYGLKDSGARFAIVDQDRWVLLESSRDLLDLGVAIARPVGDLPDGVLDLADLLQDHSHDAFPELDIDTDSDALIMYTSGSTGRPKGVVLTHRSIISGLTNFSFVGMLAAILGEDGTVANEVTEWLKGGAASVDDPIAKRLPAAAMLLNVPLFHVSGLHTMLFLSYRSGRKLVMMYKWNAEQALELAEKESLTVIEGVPTMIGEILNSPDLHTRNIETVTKIGGGGSARPPEHVKLLQEHLPQAVPGTGYGMTETNAIGTTIGGEDYIGRPSSVGRPSPKLVELEIRDENDKVLGVNEEGQICMKSAANMRCYWNKPEATEETLQDGWLYSGDLGHIDEEGFVFITGRAKDIIIRGGENIACGEIENVLYEHPAVNEVAVHGAPDDRLGEIVCATVYLKDGAEATESEIQEHVRSKLAAFKAPSHVLFSDDPLPRIASGKFDKVNLQKHAIEWLEVNK